MKTKKLILSLLASGAVLTTMSMANPATTQAATISMPTQGTSYVHRGNTYRLHLKVAGRVTITTKARYTIVNSLDWTAVPYPSKKANTKVYYLRAGNYRLTTKSAASIKTSYTKMSKLKNSLDSFPNNTAYNTPNKISLNKTYYGLSDMFHSDKLNGKHQYVFIIDKPQQVTVNISSMPIYQYEKGNIYSNTSPAMTPVTTYRYALPTYKFRGPANNKQYSWYLDKRTYIFQPNGPRGRFSFKLTSQDISDSSVIPSSSKITKISATNDGIKVDYEKVTNADGYEVYCVGSNWVTRKPFYYNANSYSGINTTSKTLPDALSQTIKKDQLTNGTTYKIAVRAAKMVNGSYVYGPFTEQDYTYYSKTSDQKTPAAPEIKLSYYDDNGSDEPYINIAWAKNDNISSYEIAYRLKGTSTWTTFMSKGVTGDEITDSSNKSDVNYFLKGKTYEVRVRALNGNLISPWSDIKSVTVNITPAGK